MQIELNFILNNNINYHHNRTDIQTEFDIWIFRWYFGQFTDKIWKFTIKIKCYPISIRKIPSNTVLLLNLVQSGIPYSINTTENTTHIYFHNNTTTNNCKTPQINNWQAIQSQSNNVHKTIMSYWTNANDT